MINRKGEKAKKTRSIVTTKIGREYVRGMREGSRAGQERCDLQHMKMTLDGVRRIRPQTLSTVDMETTDR